MGERGEVRWYISLLPYNLVLFWAGGEGATNWTIVNVSKDGGVSGQHLGAGRVPWTQR